MMSKLYSFIMSLEDPLGWLDEKAALLWKEGSYAEHPWYQVQLDELRIKTLSLPAEL